MMKNMEAIRKVMDYGTSPKKQQFLPNSPVSPGKFTLGYVDSTPKYKFSTQDEITPLKKQSMASLEHLTPKHDSIIKDKLKLSHKKKSDLQTSRKAKKSELTS